MPDGLNRSRGDMRLRRLGDKTQSAYIRAVRQLASFLGRAPDTATVEDLRRFQLHLVDHGTSPITLNATRSVTESPRPRAEAAFAGR